MKERATRTTTRHQGQNKLLGYKSRFGGLVQW